MTTSTPVRFASRVRRFLTLFCLLALTFVPGRAFAQVATVMQPELRRAEIAALPFLERPTYADSERWMLYGWRIRMQSQVRGIFARDLIDPSDRAESYLRGRVRADTELLPSVDAYVDGRLNLRWRKSRGGNQDVVVDGELSEAWLKWRQPFGVPVGFVQGGRVKQKEARGFWWDEEIETFQLGLDTSLWKGKLGVGARLTQDEIDDGGRRQLRDDFTWIFLELRHQWHFENFVEFRLLRQFDSGNRERVGDFSERLNSDEDLLWIGGRVAGKTARLRGQARTHYWLELVGLTGEETRLSLDRNGVVLAARSRTASGWAIDFGATYESALPGRLSFTAAFASASRRFRQPTLFRNRLSFVGNAPIRRYGEVLRPSLANLHVVTAAVGVEVYRDVWIETIYHGYWQQDASSRLVDDVLAQEPFGRERDLGHALDVALGVGTFEKWKFELTYGVLFAGDAFGSRSDEIAHRGSLQLRRSWP